MSTSQMADEKVSNSAKQKKLLVIGGGLTGCVTAYLLDQQSSYNVFMWDKARGLGGRMSTRRYTEGKSQVDLGAQYITATPEYYASHGTFYESLQEAGVLVPLNARIDGMREAPPGTQNFVAPGGMSTIVKHFFNSSKATIAKSRRVVQMDEKDGLVTVISEDGHQETFDKVVITIPVPQLLDLKGNVVANLLATMRTNLEQVQYSARYAMALFYPADTALNIPWACKYIKDSDVVYISLDQNKRSAQGEGLAVMVHTTVPFGLAHIDKDKKDIMPLIMPQISREIPDLPEPDHIHIQKWRYSQVHKAYPGAPGAIALTGSVVSTGDAFSHSNMDGCIAAASKACQLILRDQ